MNRRNFFFLIVALLFASVLTAGATISRDHNKPAARLPFEPAEQLIYEGEFSKLMLRGIKIAEIRFSVSQAPPNITAHAGEVNVPANLLFTGEIVSQGWFRKLFGIQFRYHVESTVEPNSLLVLRTTKLDEQGKRVRTSEAVFDRAGNQVTWTERNPNYPASTPRIVTSPLNGASHDIISAVYALRTKPLAVGQSFELLISDSGAVYQVPVKVTEKKKMKTALGKVSALRVDIEAFGDKRLIRGDGQMSLWLTDDARRLPVRARISNNLGTIDIKLKRVTKDAQINSSAQSSAHRSHR